MKNITVVGCGTMGSSIINTFMNAGLEVTIVDLNEKAAERFTARGAKYYRNLNESGDNDCILINLPNHKIANAVVTGVDK